MKKNVLFGALTLIAGSLLAADSSPKDDVIGAAQKLAATANYSWKQTVVVPESAQFKPGPSEGKTEKGGATYVKMSTFGDNTMEIAMQGSKAAVTDQDGNWQSLTNMENDAEGPGRFVVRMVRNFQAPAAMATNVVSSVKELKQDGDAYSGDLTDAGAKAQFRFGTVTNPKGSAKFWVKDGLLVKFEVKVQGKVEFNGNEFDADRDTTIEIKDIGATKVELPADAKKVL
ncbi:MAG TPA: hypothetical protein VED19_01095 [Candidatus Nitrosopolaris sp.]|nr:hypothetical protein [Candidatus Nitrosopolaris sp.]